MAGGREAPGLRRSTVKASPKETKEYSAFVAQHVPKRPLLRNVITAFLVGGTICAIGQVAFLLLLRSGMQDVPALGYVSAIMIAIGAGLTGLGSYDEVGRFGGMGSALPITGFANSIVSPAMEFKREGYVLGVSAKMFSIAGPVIVYGLITAAVVVVIRIILV